MLKINTIGAGNKIKIHLKAKKIKETIIFIKLKHFVETKVANVINVTLIEIKETYVT